MILVIVYLVAVVVANLAVAQFGPSASIVSAFLFIALDMTTRDALHERWKGNLMLPRLFGLILVGSALSWLINRDAEKIAIASAAAFAAAGAADTLVYWLLGSKDRYIKVNGSNVASALADSIVFPVLAFGFPVLVWVIVGQFVAKVVGGAIWYVILRRYMGSKSGDSPENKT